MKKVLLVDYIGNCNQKGEPIGHPLKVLDGYTEMLSDSFVLEVAAPEAILKMRNLQQHFVLPYSKKIVANQSIHEKIRMISNEYKNIRMVMSVQHCDICLFYNVDWILYLYLMLHKKSRLKLICISYQNMFANNGIGGKIKNYIMKCGLRKLDEVFYSIPRFEFHIPKLYTPDYFYETKKYDQYLEREKEEKVVCLGTMNHMKKLREIVLAFRKIDYKLEIVGEFQEKELLFELNSLKTDNIIIEDKYLSEDEYLLKMAEAKYSIIPYDTSFYEGRTSGVVIESIFLNAVPITQNEILSNNEVPGIGYENINHLEIPDLYQFNTDDFKQKYELLRRTRFDWAVNRDRIKQALHEM